MTVPPLWPTRAPSSMLQPNTASYVPDIKYTQETQTLEPHMTADSPARPPSSNTTIAGLQPEALFMKKTTGTAATAPPCHKSIEKPVQSDPL